MATSRVFSIQGLQLNLHTKADAQPHLDQLARVEGVEEIRLGGNTWGVEASQALADALRGNKTLKVANLSDIFTGRLITEIPQALSAICDALITVPTLEELDLSDNAFGGRSADPIVPFVIQHKTFSILKLNNNGLGVTGGIIIAKALLQAAESAKAEGRVSTLRTVICGRNRLENGSAPYWADAFKAHGGLREVRMPQNGIRMEGVEALAKGLSACPNLEALDLQDNTLAESGSRAVALALPSWPNLRDLNLGDCYLKPKGGLALGTVFARGVNPKLEILKLQYGEIDSRTVDLVAKAIKDYWSNLKHLELDGNIGDAEDECFQNVKDALEGHGNADAFVELEDMMDPAEYEAEDEEEEHIAVEEAEELDRQDDDDDESPKPPPPAGSASAKIDQAADDLADLLGKVSIGEAPAQS